jgi:colanic acid/amylovoran biosynthesis glycosyltransferase
MGPDPARPTVLHAKFQAWLSWSQPFLHDLVTGLDASFRNVVVCTRAENLDRFPVRHLVRLPAHALVQPSHALLAAARLRRDWSPRLIHAHFGWSGLRALLFRHYLGVPLVTTFGGRDVAMQANLAALKPLYDVLLAASDGIVCVSESLRQVALARGADPARTCVIRRGTALAEFPFHERPLRAAGEPARVLMVGRIVAKKGHALAVEALARLAHQGVPVALRIVGEGEEEPALRARCRQLGVAERVTVTGTLTREQVRAELAAADLLLHCSVTTASGDVEGIPNAVVEAAATGLPVVATRHGGLEEAVVHGVTGLLVGEGEGEALARALGSLARDPARCRALGRAAAARARAEFDGATQVERHAALYRDLAAAHPPGDPALRLSLRAARTLPERFQDVLRHPEEFSVGELVDAHVAPRTWLERGWPAWLERTYDLRRRIPGRLKFPVKLALARALTTFGWRRYPSPAEEARVLAAFEAGLGLDRVDPDASVDELRRIVRDATPDPRGGS